MKSGRQQTEVGGDIPSFACGIDCQVPGCNPQPRIHLPSRQRPQSTDERTSPVQENMLVGEVEESHEIHSIENVHARAGIFWVLTGFVSSRHVSLLHACQEHPTKFEGRKFRTGNSRLLAKAVFFSTFPYTQDVTHPFTRGKRSSMQHGRKVVDSIQPCLDEP